MTAGTPTADAARFDFAEELIREAGALALSYYGDIASLTIRDKGINDVASNADVETEELIRERLSKAWPDDAFVGEETGATEPAPGQGAWVVDPIDGTACFVKGIPGWSISIAYFRDREVELGLVADPVHGELFAGRRNHGATLNGAPIRCGTDTDFTRGLTGLSVSHRVPPDALAPVLVRLLSAGGMFLRNGSCALSLAYVACGRLNAYYQPHIYSWDSFAGYLLVREAGGWTNDFLSDDMLLHGGEIAVAAPGLREEFAKITGGE